MAPPAARDLDPAPRRAWLLLAVVALLPTIGDTGGFRPVDPLGVLAGVGAAPRAVFGA